MSNYIIDGSINFYEELMKDEETDENNVCLLSNLPLDQTQIELPCSHKFNYIYIFNEVKSSKKTNALNIGYGGYNNYNIKSHEIKCPYCRKIFDNLLPPCKNIQGTTLLKNVNKSNNSLSIKCKDEDSNCASTVYVTDIGYYCSHHYKQHKLIVKDKTKNNIKNKDTKQKKHTKDNCNCPKNNNNIYMDSSMNMISGSYANKAFITMDLINNHIIDVSLLEYHIDQKYTVKLLKEILKYNKKILSGNKNELIKRIIDNQLYELL